MGFRTRDILLGNQTLCQLYQSYEAMGSPPRDRRSTQRRARTMSDSLQLDGSSDGVHLGPLALSRRPFGC